MLRSAPLFGWSCTVAGLLTLGAFFAPGTANIGTSPAQPDIDTLRTLSSHVFAFTNRERTQKNLNRLAADDALWRIACHYSRDMLRRDFFRHEDPDGNGPSDRVAKRHRRLIGEAGENLWARSGPGTPTPKSLAEKIVTQWMNSPPHRKNILRPRFTHMAACVLKQGDVWRGTQMFARVRAYLASPLPRTATAGSAIEASVEQTVPPSDSIAKYDFWNPETNERISEPTLFADTLHIPKTTGPLRPRFYVPESGRYSIHSGPEIEVTSPQ